MSHRETTEVGKVAENTSVFQETTEEAVSPIDDLNHDEEFVSKSVTELNSGEKNEPNLESSEEELKGERKEEIEGERRETTEVGKVAENTSVFQETTEEAVSPIDDLNHGEEFVSKSVTELNSEEKNEPNLESSEEELKGERKEEIEGERKEEIEGERRETTEDGRGLAKN